MPTWLNQIVIEFSVLQRKLLTPNHLPDLSLLAQPIGEFIPHHNTSAEPIGHTANKLVEQFATDECNAVLRERRYKIMGQQSDYRRTWRCSPTALRARSEVLMSILAALAAAERLPVRRRYGVWRFVSR